MDVFKTHVGEGKALMINEENFYLATRERKPYVVDSGGVKSFYAVCPECDNPIQLIGLLRRQQDSLPHRPYGRHTGHDVPGVAVYDEDAYLSCPFSDPGYWRTDRKRKPSNPTGQALYRIMRDRFDRVEYAWRESSGLLLGIKSLRRALTVWRNDKGWLNYGSTYHNLPQMLFFGLPQETLYGHACRRTRRSLPVWTPRTEYSWSLRDSPIRTYGSRPRVSLTSASFWGPERRGS